MMHDHDHVHTELEVSLEEIEAWLAHGVKMGYCGPPMCHEHDGQPPADTDEFACPIYVRIYKTVDEMDWVEAHHENSREFKKRFDKEGT